MNGIELLLPKYIHDLYCLRRDETCARRRSSQGSSSTALMRTRIGWLLAMPNLGAKTEDAVWSALPRFVAGERIC
jgi:hypothetical protein